MDYKKSDICVIGDLICMGCCGDNYTNREEIIEAIRRNTGEYKESKSKKDFMNRHDADAVRKCGVCRNVIFSDDSKKQVMCPLHPIFNEDGDSKDIRDGHCDIYYLCKAAFCFSMWDEKKRRAFVSFILKKKPDWYEFSMGMDSDTYLNEFLEQYEAQIRR
jgi:hypothetical protein